GAVLAVGGHDHGVGTAAIAEIAALLLQRPGHDVEGDSAGRHLGVVDLADLLGVVEARQPERDVHRGGIARPAAGRRFSRRRAAAGPAAAGRPGPRAGPSWRWPRPR